MTGEIPDTWPPREDAPLGTGLPMFPLQGVFLFPRQVMPLHIFEPRYRQMIEDCLDAPGRIVMATVLVGEQESPQNAPRVLPVGGLGEIARHDRMPGGRFHVWLFGLGRVALEEVSSDRLYRRADVHPLREIEPQEAVAVRLDTRLRAALATRLDPDVELPEEMPFEALVDLLCQRLRVPQPVMEEVFVERDLGRRAELALAAHAQYP